MSITTDHRPEKASGAAPGKPPAVATADGPARLRRIAVTVYQRVVLPMLGPVVAVAAWWWAARFFEVNPAILPAPPDVAASLRDNAAHLLDDVWITVYETLGGFALGAGAGLLIAAGLATSRTLERATMPLVICLNAIPIVAVAPLLVHWLGLYHKPKIALAALICFFPIMLATKAGLTSTPADLGELARSLSASRWQTFCKFRVPWALPQVFVGLKLGITLSLIGTVVAQMVRPSGGLGTVILKGQQVMNTAQSFAVILLLMVLSITLFYLVVLAERLLLPWARETAATRR